MGRDENGQRLGRGKPSTAYSGEGRTPDDQPSSPTRTRTRPSNTARAATPSSRLAASATGGSREGQDRSLEASGGTGPVEPWA
jgi:hypothetical protein